MNHLTIERLREIVADGVSRSWGWVEFRAMAAELLAARETIAAQLSAGKALYEATQKLMAERDAARTELAAASERVDLDIDEFRRIKAELGNLRVGLPPLTEDSARSLYAVVACICDRAVAAGRQRVPLIAQRDKAEAERDEARQHHENALAIAGHNIERVKKLDAENKAQFETLDALRGLHDQLLAAVMDGTAEFRDWQECEADAIEEQEAEVERDHNRMLAALRTLRRKAEHVQNGTRAVVEAGSLPAHLERAEQPKPVAWPHLPEVDRPDSEVQP